jgi:putative oxidoreductase
MSMQEARSSLPVLSHADKLAAQSQDFLLLAARLLMGWIFIQSGWGKLMNVPGFVASMPRRGLPDFLGYVAPPVEFIGGILMVVGFATRYTALVMLLFVIVASFSSHRYWAVEPAQVANQSSHFWKNVTIKGGLVLLFITGAGRFALDWMLAKRR